MPGHYGVEQVTEENLEVVKVDTNRDLLFVRGAVPGHKNGFVTIYKTDLVKKVPPVSDKAKKKADIRAAIKTKKK